MRSVLNCYTAALPDKRCRTSDGLQWRALLHMLINSQELGTTARDNETGQRQDKIFRVWAAATIQVKYIRLPRYKRIHSRLSATMQIVQIPNYTLN